MSQQPTSAAQRTPHRAAHDHSDKLELAAKVGWATKGMLYLTLQLMFARYRTARVA